MMEGKYAWLIYAAMFAHEWNWKPFGFWKVWSVLSVFEHCFPNKERNSQSHMCDLSDCGSDQKELKK